MTSSLDTSVAAIVASAPTTVIGAFELVQNTAKVVFPNFIVQAISQLSFLTHFDRVARGVIDLPSLFFYLSMIVFFLFANMIIVEQKKAA